MTALDHTTTALVELVDRPAVVAYTAAGGTVAYLEGLVIAVDGDHELEDGGAVIVRTDDGDYRTIGLAHVRGAGLAELELDDGGPCPYCDEAYVTVDGTCVHCGAVR
jgi:hypothetical protein